MTVKSKRSQRTKHDPDSFGAWFAEKCDRKKAVRPLEDEYMTLEAQMNLCWRMRRWGYDPYSGIQSSLSDELMWHDMSVMERQLDELLAWEEHDFPYTIHEFDCVQDTSVDNEFFTEDDATYSMSAETLLLVRIFSTFPSITFRTETKKRRMSDRSARNERRDGSSRGKLYRDVDKAHNRNIRRSERRLTRQTLLAEDANDDVNDMPATAGTTITGWDKGTPMRFCSR